MNTIPFDTALQICQQIRQQNQRRLLTYHGLWCWGCATFTKEAQQRCFNSAPDCRGCAQVNKVFDKKVSLTPQR